MIPFENTKAKGREKEYNSNPLQKIKALIKLQDNKHAAVLTV